MIDGFDKLTIGGKIKYKKLKSNPPSLLAMADKNCGVQILSEFLDADCAD
jgi:hypothetical protein